MIEDAAGRRVSTGLVSKKARFATLPTVSSSVPTKLSDSCRAKPVRSPFATSWSSTVLSPSKVAKTSTSRRSCAMRLMVKKPMPPQRSRAACQALMPCQVESALMPAARASRYDQMLWIVN